MGNRVISFRLPEEKILRLKQIAARDRKTLTAVIEDSLDVMLGAGDPPMKNSERLAYMIGAGRSGRRTDVTKMDLGEILQERYDRDGHL
jgi:hypothetical protein